MKLNGISDDGFRRLGQSIEDQDYVIDAVIEATNLALEVVYTLDSLSRELSTIPEGTPYADGARADLQSVLDSAKATSETMNAYMNTVLNQGNTV